MKKFEDFKIKLMFVQMHYMVHYDLIREYSKRMKFKQESLWMAILKFDKNLKT